LTAFAYGQTVTSLQLLGVAIVIAGLLLPRIVKWQQQRFSRQEASLAN
jgi:drug/metabolite transporter (DMT)-like permease